MKDLQAGNNLGRWMLQLVIVPPSLKVSSPSASASSLNQNFSSDYSITMDVKLDSALAKLQVAV